MKINSHLIKLIGVACNLLLIVGCSSDMSDLQAYTNEMKTKFQGSVEPLPRFPPPKLHVYRSDRNPFEPLSKVERANAATTNAKAPPSRPLEPLEFFPLDSLAMVGTLQRGGVRWGLIRDTESKIHRVKIGNHLGQNYGSISEITPSSITITELIQDSAGLWVDRQSQLHVGE